MPEYRLAQTSIVNLWLKILIYRGLFSYIFRSAHRPMAVQFTFAAHKVTKRCAYQDRTFNIGQSPWLRRSYMGTDHFVWFLFNKWSV